MPPSAQAKPETSPPECGAIGALCSDDHRARQHHEPVAAIVVIHEHRRGTVRRRDQAPAHQAIARTRQVRQLHRLLQAVRHPLHQLRAVGCPHLDRPDPIRRIDAVGVQQLPARARQVRRAKLCRLPRITQPPRPPMLSISMAATAHQTERGPPPPALDHPRQIELRRQRLVGDRRQRLAQQIALVRRKRRRAGPCRGGLPDRRRLPPRRSGSRTPST